MQNKTPALSLILHIPKEERFYFLNRWLRMPLVFYQRFPDFFFRRKGKGDFAKQLKDEDGFGGGDGPRIIVDQNGMGPTGGYITR